MMNHPWIVGSLCVLLVAGCSSTDVPDEGIGSLVDVAPAQIEQRQDGILEQSTATKASSRVPLIIPPVRVDPSEDYTIGPGDVLQLRIGDIHRPGEDGQFLAEVSERGCANIALVGEVKVADLSVEQARQGIIQGLERFIRRPRVDVQIKEYRSKRIQVHGEVNKPGTFFIPKNSLTVIEALSLAGGIQTRTAGMEVFITRADDKGGATQYLVDLAALLDRGATEGNRLRVEPQDVIYVPQAERVYVMGYIYRPGSYPLRRAMTALELVADAGGALPRVSSPSQAFLRRREEAGTYRIIRLDLERIMANRDSDVQLIAGDTIMIPQSGWTFGINEAWSILKGRAGSYLPAVPN
jgi:polysaccharide export outer membrane protein